MLWAGLAWSTPLQDTLVGELDRAVETFSTQSEKPYYIAVSVEDREERRVTARSGALSTANTDRGRTLDVDMRVGAPDLDSTHPMRGFSSLDSDNRNALRIPLDDGYALEHALWRELDRAYRQGAEAIVMVRANQQVKVEEEDPAPDFQLKRTPVVETVEVPALTLDIASWKPVITALSKRVEASPAVHQSTIQVLGERIVETLVDTDGTRLQHGRVHARFGIQLLSTADDGDKVSVFRSVDVHDPGTLPDADAMNAMADEAVERLEALRVAPRGEPYSGPVILSGRSSGVFFHEVLGHRVEGHRQKRDDEGKTFADHVGKPILPDFIDVYDDPNLSREADTDLNGHYRWDSEGEPAARADIVDDGVFKGFLMSRSPISGFENSNGHGRRSPGALPKARMGNTVVEARNQVSDAELRQLLIAELKRQKLPYGYIVEDIDGGFTMTGRMMPNAFNVRASASWRVYVDGRPDELVRGIDLVGTPLVAFSNLMAAGQTREVFNGTCGAESGWVPVSAVAPSLLFRKLEFQLKEKASERPPLLDKPTASDIDLAAAMEAQLARNNDKLKLAEAPPIYHFRSHLMMLDQVDISASLGSLVRKNTEPLNMLGVEIRLGDPSYDNTGFGGWQNGLARVQLPGSVTGDALQVEAWRLADRAYMQAVEQLARKKAQFQPPEDYPGDYTLTGATTFDGGVSKIGDAAALERLAVSLSGELVGNHILERGTVDVGHEAGYTWMRDTEGSDVKRPVEETTLRAWAHLRTTDGMLITDHALWTVRRPDLLPDEAAMKATTQALRDRLADVAAAPPLDSEYVGPMVFEDHAAADLFRYLLIDQLEGTPPEVPFESWFGDLGSSKDPVRLGRRVLPPGWAVHDDPMATPEHPGSFTHDIEGTPAQAVDLVDDGIVRTVLMSRIPRRGVEGTNGHARALPASRPQARASLVQVEAPKLVSNAKLYKQALKIAQSYGRDWVLVVRRLQEPAVMRAGSGGGFFLFGGPGDDASSLPPPVYVVKRYADGREELVRGTKFASVQRFVLRDILAASEPHAVDYLAPIHGDYGSLGPTEGMPTRITAPNVLVGEVELEPSPGDATEMPLLSPPQ